MNVLASLTVLGLLVFFHESGHFLAAKIQGIRVSGFSIGFGPAILKKEYKGVTYSIRLLPLGGFVSFPDDNADENLSPEGDYLMCPKNAIFEIKFPSVDIKGKTR